MKRLLLLAALCLFIGNVFAANLKVGIVNLDEVIQKAPLAISFNDKISKDFKPRQDALNSAQKKLQDDMDQLTYSNYKMTASERNQLQAKINAEKRDFDVLNASFQKDFIAAQADYNQKLMTKLNEVVGKIAQSESYDLIQSSANTLYLNNAINITPQVIELMK